MSCSNGSRRHRRRRSTSDGAGLGLALVAEHVRMHGGRVWVEIASTVDPAPGSSSSFRRRG
ncbi:MAG: hypothetical protein R2705_20575 [Ilumatobacteraceae bacterium]